MQARKNFIIIKIIIIPVYKVFNNIIIYNGHKNQKFKNMNINFFNIIINFVKYNNN